MKPTKNQMAEAELRASTLECFAKIPDPRVERTRRHPLVSILVLSRCAVVCEADHFVALETFGKAKLKWLRTFLDLPRGVPSHDTIDRLLAALNPTALGKAFRERVQNVSQLTHGAVVAIDGQTPPRAIRDARGTAFVHLVSAWATRNHVVLGPVMTDENSNEIAAMPHWLKMLAIKNRVVTIDAMRCQKDILRQIVEAEADYMIAVKDNQPTLRGDIENIFAELRQDAPSGLPLDFHQTRDAGHGRTEVRRCWTTNTAEAVPHWKDWRALRSLVMIASERTADGKTSTERRCHIASVQRLPAATALRNPRAHWAIENGVHAVLDVGFPEFDRRVRVDTAAQNFWVVRHLAVNLPQSVQETKVGIRNRRLRAEWDHDFMLRVLVSGTDVG